VLAVLGVPDRISAIATFEAGPSWRRAEDVGDLVEPVARFGRRPAVLARRHAEMLSDSVPADANEFPRDGDGGVSRRGCGEPDRSPSWQDGGMERVLGIGGYFMRAADPAALSAWYRDCLGLDADENGLWRQGVGATVFATFESETDYFGSRAQQTMLNFRVRDLDAMLAQLRDMGADVDKETQDMEGVGRFGWVTDPAGNRVELWQPT
jgi:predicted enzyme related to lactoylglutathione lyase